MSKAKDLTGQRFGRLVVRERGPDYVQENGRKRIRWICECDCGNIYVADGDHLKQGDIYSCGCAKNEKAAERMRARKGTHPGSKRSKDLTGQKFGKLLVIGPGGFTNSEKENHKMWKVKCDCGQELCVRQCHLVTGNQTTCGCEKSKGENLVYNLLKESKEEFSREYNFPDLLSEKGNRLRFDFAIFENGILKGLIEYQGEQHDSNFTKGEFGKQQRETTDKQKRIYCAEKKLPLFEIWYFENIKEKLTQILHTIHNMSIPCQDSKE